MYKFEIQREIDWYLGEMSTLRRLKVCKINDVENPDEIFGAEFMSYTFTEIDLDGVKEFIDGFIDDYHDTIIIYLALVEVQLGVYILHIGHLDYNILSEMKDAGVDWYNWDQYVKGEDKEGLLFNT